MEVTISFNKSNTRTASNKKTTSVKIVNPQIERIGEGPKSISGVSRRSSGRVLQRNNTSSVKLQTRNLNLKENVYGVGNPKETLTYITDKLVLLGYSLESINMAFNRYKFKSVDQALMIMGLDPETGFYHHQFYPKKKLTGNLDDTDSEGEEENKSPYYNPQMNSRICVICKDVKEKHFDLYSENTSNAPVPYPNINNRSSNNLSVFQETNNNLIQNEERREDFNNLNKKGIINEKIKIDPSFIEKLEVEFKDKNLCIICYANEINDNSYKFPCGHTFCNECVKQYLLNLINESKVENIKCLQAGCTSMIPEGSIKENISPDNFNKYVRFKRRSGFLNNLRKGFIPCTAPDCEEWINYREGSDPFVECEQGHRFCAKCKEGWHNRTDCRNKNVERVLKLNNRIRTCPSCGNFIEKADGCNHMTCTVCNYEFCWLCMRKYEYYHYYVFNLKGCPGMRFANPKSKNSAWSNPFFKCLWCLLTIFLGVLAVALLITLWFFLGATYELIKCFHDKKVKKEEDENEESEGSNYESPNSSNISQINNIQPADEIQRTKTQLFFIYFGLTIAGLLLQPVYLLFKMIEALMECYRRYGCWFYYFSSY